MSTTTYSWSDEEPYENTSWGDSSGNLDGQQPVITLRAAFTLQSDTSVNRKYLTVDLSNTTVSASNKQPAAIVDNSSSARGWYTEEVQISMKFSDSTLEVWAVAPTTTAIQGTSSSSSTSETSAGVGFEGSSPAANLSFSYSSTNSFDTSVTDFTASNSSSATVPFTTYSLSAIPAGKYSSYKSLEDKHYTAGILDSVTLHEVEENGSSAISDLTTPSQAIWMTSSGSYASSAKLTLTITHKLAKVTVTKKKKDDGLEVEYTTSEEECSYTFAKTYTIDFSKVDNVYVAS
jgi:hypothetical protein